jgi:formyl-CoA transferase
MLASYTHPVFGPVEEVGVPLKLGGFAPEYRMAPRLGQDNADILEGLGYGAEEIAALEASGAFGRYRRGE